MRISKKVIRSLALATALGGAAFVALPAIAGTVLNGATVTNAARGTLAGSGVNSTDIVQANVNLPANGGAIDWHTHPGQVYGVVTGGGTVTIVDEDCVEHEYPTGTAFTPPWTPHTARNFSDQPATVRITFILPKKAGDPPPPPTVFVSAQEDDKLDARCGLVD